MSQSDPMGPSQHQVQGEPRYSAVFGRAESASDVSQGMETSIADGYVGDGTSLQGILL